jgi:hypothetical protein
VFIFFTVLNILTICFLLFATQFDVTKAVDKAVKGTDVAKYADKAKDAVEKAEDAIP